MITVRSMEHLKALLDEGRQSGPAVELTEADWQRLREDVAREAINQRKGKEGDCAGRVVPEPLDDKA